MSRLTDLLQQRARSRHRNRINAFYDRMLLDAKRILGLNTGTWPMQPEPEDIDGNLVSWDEIHSENGKQYIFGERPETKLANWKAQIQGGDSRAFEYNLSQQLLDAKTDVERLEIIRTSDREYAAELAKQGIGFAYFRDSPATAATLNSRVAVPQVGL